MLPRMDQHATLAAARVRRFLEEEPVVWLSTVRPDGTPHIVPVWFWWDGEAVLVFSKPDALKVRNMRENPAVMLAVGDPDEDFDIGLLEGRAEMLDRPDRRGHAGGPPREVRRPARGHRPDGRGVRRHLLAGHPDRARPLPRLARPERCRRACAVAGAPRRIPRRAGPDRPAEPPRMARRAAEPAACAASGRGSSDPAGAGAL